MNKSALVNLQDAVTLLADEIGDGTLIIELASGKNYALISQSYLDALLRKADAYDDLTKTPEEKAEEQKNLLAKMRAMEAGDT